MIIQAARLSIAALVFAAIGGLLGIELIWLFDL